MCVTSAIQVLRRTSAAHSQSRRPRAYSRWSNLVSAVRRPDSHAGTCGPEENHESSVTVIDVRSKNERGVAVALE